jgi:hypothetical protein
MLKNLNYKTNVYNLLIIIEFLSSTLIQDFFIIFLSSIHDAITWYRLIKVLTIFFFKFKNNNNYNNLSKLIVLY